MKRYIILLNLILITVGIYLGVKAVYKIVTVKLEFPGQSEIAGNQKIHVSFPDDKTKHPLSYYKPIADRNLFKTKVNSAKKAELKKTETTEPPKETELNLKLWGTITGTRPYAVIQKKNERKQTLYKLGAIVQDAIIKKIFRDKIILSINGKNEILKMEKFSSGNRTRRPSPAKTGKPYRQSVSIRRSDIEKATRDITSLMKKVRIRPHFKNGKPDGLAISRIRGNSIFRKLGLRNGDVLLSVNGDKIESVDDALNFYKNLKNSSKVQLDIKRRGRTRTMDYNIR